MQKARQLNDQILVRLILKKLARLGRSGAMSTANGCMVFPFPAIQAPAESLDQGPHIPDFLTSNDSKGGDKMDKKTVIFFSLFALLMIGGSFAICLWFIPVEVRWNGAGLLTANDFTSVDHSPRNWILMITQMIGTICIVLLVGMRLKKWFSKNKQSTIQGYICKIIRVTGKSAYDVFCKAAEDWPVSEGQIEQDFKRYMLNDEIIPYYVNDFIRKNKKHLDKMRISIFMFKGID
jgi:hypothetical protein